MKAGLGGLAWGICLAVASNYDLAMPPLLRAFLLGMGYAAFGYMLGAAEAAADRTEP